MFKLWILGFVLGTVPLPVADTIMVNNESDFDFYGAVYYFKKTADLVGSIKPIPARAKQTFERPPARFLVQRCLVFSLNKADLKPQLTSSELHILPYTGVDLDTSYYLALDRGAFKGYNSFEWFALEPFKKKVSERLKSLDELTFGQVRRIYMDNPLIDVLPYD